MPHTYAWVSTIEDIAFCEGPCIMRCVIVTHPRVSPRGDTIAFCEGPCIMRQWIRGCNVMMHPRGLLWLLRNACGVHETPSVPFWGHPRGTPAYCHNPCTLRGTTLASRARAIPLFVSSPFGPFGFPSGHPPSTPAFRPIPCALRHSPRGAHGVPFGLTH